MIQQSPAPAPQPECPFCKMVREMLMGGLGMLKIGAGQSPSPPPNIKRHNGK